jgi:hypothetical protein
MDRSAIKGGEEATLLSLFGCWCSLSPMGVPGATRYWSLDWPPRPTRTPPHTTLVAHPALLVARQDPRRDCRRRRHEALDTTRRAADGHNKFRLNASISICRANCTL